MSVKELNIEKGILSVRIDDCMSYDVITVIADDNIRHLIIEDEHGIQHIYSQNFDRRIFQDTLKSYVYAYFHDQEVIELEKTLYIYDWIKETDIEIVCTLTNAKLFFGDAFIGSHFPRYNEIELLKMAKKDKS